ncbi:hypothetical protein WKR88_09895 [Trinickia caryophylli]|uniref:hypothetical protein n=1 Tax=Trinickia caryophylli TaxID=28094 RepID=UPI002E0E427A|nr:hypothetical protein U0034_10335 [Trinickia caryophylli]
MKLSRTTFSFLARFGFSAGDDRTGADSERACAAPSGFVVRRFAGFDSANFDSAGWTSGAVAPFVSFLARLPVLAAFTVFTAFADFVAFAAFAGAACSVVVLVAFIVFDAFVVLIIFPGVKRYKQYIPFSSTRTGATKVRVYP